MLQQIRQFLRLTPFQPFEIRCSNGDVFRIGHPENATVLNHFVSVALPDGENAILLSALHIVGFSGVDQVAA